jgi:indole-3-glycerol phosphate synthase
MTQRTGTILDRIVEHKREELAAARAATPLAVLRARAVGGPVLRDFTGALRRPGISLIAEVKKASPSRGVLREDFDDVALAEQYAAAGASAISVLTDQEHFQGTLADLSAIRETLPDGPPLLRKDFLFDEYQLYEARVHGADAILLIVAILEQDLLTDLMAGTAALGMTALVEVHDESEVERALDADARVIGVNNRDLHSFELDLATTERLRPLYPGTPLSRRVASSQETTSSACKPAASMRCLSARRWWSQRTRKQRFASFSDDKPKSRPRIRGARAPPRQALLQHIGGARGNRLDQPVDGRLEFIVHGRGSVGSAARSLLGPRYRRRARPLLHLVGGAGV